ncbi:MAG: hypothetical protein MZV63_49090 [Marinilabiliales bacterium]|nr:hypothetical protein [Marinilabiliales bacterium]
MSASIPAISALLSAPRRVMMPAAIHTRRIQEEEFSSCSHRSYLSCILRSR